jgi:hypothetical protein
MGSDINWTVCGPSFYVLGVVFPISSGKWELGRTLAHAKIIIMQATPVGVAIPNLHVKVGVDPPETRHVGVAPQPRTRVRV